MIEIKEKIKIPERFDFERWIIFGQTKDCDCHVWKIVPNANQCVKCGYTV